MSSSIRRWIVEKKKLSAGLVLLIIGLISLFGSLTLAYLDYVGTWTGTPKGDFLSVLLEPRSSSEPISLGMEGMMIIYYVVGGLVIAVIGGVLSATAMKMAPIAEEVAITLMCSSCKKTWEESVSKTTLESMGYPRVRTLSRRRCPRCGRFTRPRIVAVGGEPVREPVKGVVGEEAKKPTGRRRAKKAKRQG